MNHIDAMNSVTPDTAARDALTVVDAIQDLPPGRQMAAVAFLFFAVMQRHGKDTRDALLASEARFRDALDVQLNHRPGDATRALADYIRSELR